MMHLVVLSCVVLLSMLGVVLGVRDPYKPIEADSMDFNKGASVLTNTSASGGKYVSNLLPANYIGYSQLDFSEETAAFELQMWNQLDYILESQVQLRLDSPTSTPFLTFVTPHGGKRWILSTLLIPVDQRPRGVHDLYFTFQDPKASTLVLAIDWFRFITLDSLLPPSHTLCTPEDKNGGKWPWENKCGKWPWDNKCGKWPWDNKVNPNNPGGHWTPDHSHGPDGRQKQIVINIC